MNNAGSTLNETGDPAVRDTGQNSLIHDSIEGLGAERRVENNLGAKFISEQLVNYVDSNVDTTGEGR